VAPCTPNATAAVAVPCEYCNAQWKEKLTAVDTGRVQLKPVMVCRLVLAAVVKSAVTKVFIPEAINPVVCVAPVPIPTNPGPALLTEVFAVVVASLELLLNASNPFDGIWILGVPA